jgi:hypothetical protein
MKTINCDDVGTLKEYLGVKQEAKLTQPVLLQSFKDEFTFKHYKDNEYPCARINVDSRKTRT